MKRVAIIFSALILMGFANGEKANKIPAVERGTLLLNIRPAALDSFILSGKINLAYVRKVCNFLTDAGIPTYEGHPVPTRKKAFVRHIKTLEETLEENYQDQRTISDSTLEIFYELALFDASLKQKAISNLKIMTWRDKLRMARTTRKSEKIFRYDLKDRITNHEANNVNADN